MTKEEGHYVALVRVLRAAYKSGKISINAIEVDKLSREPDLQAKIFINLNTSDENCLERIRINFSSSRQKVLVYMFKKGNVRESYLWDSEKYVLYGTYIGTTLDIVFEFFDNFYPEVQEEIIWHFEKFNRV